MCALVFSGFLGKHAPPLEFVTFGNVRSSFASMESENIISSLSLSLEHALEHKTADPLINFKFVMRHRGIEVLLSCCLFVPFLCKSFSIACRLFCPQKTEEEIYIKDHEGNTFAHQRPY